MGRDKKHRVEIGEDDQGSTSEEAMFKLSNSGGLEKAKIKNVVGRGKKIVTSWWLWLSLRTPLWSHRTLPSVWRPFLLPFPAPCALLLLFQDPAYNVASPEVGRGASLAASAHPALSLHGPLPSLPVHLIPPSTGPRDWQGSITTSGWNSPDLRFEQHCSSTYYLHTLYQTSSRAE